jgi:hypothetical protein
MLCNNPAAALLIQAWAVGAWLNQHLNPAGAWQHAQQAKAKQAAKFTGPAVAVSTPPGDPHGQPNLVSYGHPVHALQQQFQREAELHLYHYQEGRFASAERDDIAAADLALGSKAQAFEILLYCRV